MIKINLKEYPNSNLTLNDLLQDLNSHSVQIKFILRELESRGYLSNGISLLWGYISEFFSIEERKRISPK